MRTALFIGIISLYIIMQGISGWMQDTYFDQSTMDTASSIMQPELSQQTSTLGVISSTASTAIAWFKQLWNIFWFHPEMFTGNWQIIWWIFFMPIGAAMAIGIIFVIRGVASW